MRSITTNIRWLLSQQKIKNPYQILGLSQGASEDDIKSAYYRLAKQYHPDMKPQEGDKFRDISQAYNLLKDPFKRQQFQRINSKVKDRPDIKEVHKSYYNRHFHYGYTNKYTKNAKTRVNDYEPNPFATKTDPIFSSQFTRQMFKQDNQKHQKKNIAAMNSSVKWALIGIASFVGIFLVAEAMLSIYKFNHYKQKEIGNVQQKEKKVSRQYF